MDATTTPGPRPGIGEYLIRKICEAGAGHVFGVPGDYILNFYAMLARSPLQVINTCDEQGAGFAADAYARLHGFGVVCVTYNVGGFKVLNPAAGAFAEKSPLLVIAGAPGWQERKNFPLLHHKAGDFRDQFEFFKRITVASTELSDPAAAFSEIDRVIGDILRKKGPGFIELPRDIVTLVPESMQKSPASTVPGNDDRVLPKDVLDRIVSIVNGSSRPVIWAGEEVARHRLGPSLQAFAEKARIPLVSSMLGKSVVDERNPLFLGVYAGVIGDDRVREYVEASDSVIVAGVGLNDVNRGGNTAALDPDRMIVLSGDSCRIGPVSYDGSGLAVIRELSGKQLVPHDLSGMPPSQAARRVAFSPTSAKITAERLFLAIDSFVDDSDIVIAETGDAAMGSLSLTTHGPDRFLCGIYYSSLGFAVPAAIGAGAACPGLRPIAIVGDGAFQMTGMELSTGARYGMDPIVIVLNNAGFGTERPMIDGSFNDVHPWQYHHIPDIIGKGAGFLARTEDELSRALAEARESGDLAVVEVILDPDDITPQLRRMCQRLAKAVKR